MTGNMLGDKSVRWSTTQTVLKKDAQHSPERRNSFTQSLYAGETAEEVAQDKPDQHRSPPSWNKVQQYKWSIVYMLSIHFSCAL